MIKLQQDEQLRKIIEEIQTKHSEILDDWNKVNFASIYEKKGRLDPMDFELVEENCNIENGKLSKKYYFKMKKNICPFCGEKA